MLRGLLLLVLVAPVFAGDLIDVDNYDVALTPDFEQESIVGSTTVEFRAQRRTATIRFSSPNLTLDSVTVAGTSVPFDDDGSTLTIHLQTEIEPGARAAVTARYHGASERGLVFDDGLVYSDYFTCQWMICAQDDFGDKAALRLTLELPRGASAFAPGRLVSKKALPNGGERQVWEERRPYSAYLFGFVAGRFIRLREHGRGAELLYLSSTMNEVDLRRAFAPTAQMVKFFEDKSGVALPQRSYAQVLVPGDIAQEKVNFSLLGSELLEAMDKDPREDWAIAHELAHQWWGNSLTSVDLSQFWLNEGITVFMVAAWKEQRWGRDAYDRDIRLARERVDAAKEAGVDRRLTSREPYPSLSLRRAIQYSKGALFMDRLRSELGDELFWRGFKAYTRAHVGQPVTSADLQRAFERASGRDLSRLFAAWVFEPG